MPTRDFDAARAERLRVRGLDPITFTLGGETFTCVPLITVGAGFDLADAPDVEVGSAAYTQSLRSFLREAIIDDDLERFEKVLRSKQDPIGPNDLFEVVSWLSEVYAGRPTSPSTDSSGGRDSTGPTSSSEPPPMASATSAA